ncbi:MAG: hypothetical protein PHC50_01620 [Candidatus Cloacimonetes bacterium]|nr:hypothetical protein [Candidatus Cloacimonadota bacterium]
MITEDSFNMWKWFFAGLEDKNGKSKSGLSSFLDYWLIFHVVFATLCSLLIKVSIFDLSKIMIVPILSVFVGITISIMGVALSLVVSDELIKISEDEPAGIETIIYGHQVAILVLMVTLVLWLLPSIFEKSKIISYMRLLVYCAKFVLFFALSVSVRECWHVIKRTTRTMVAIIAVKEIR